MTVYTHDRDAVLVTHDKEFSQRRRRNVIGRHVYLRCNEWDGPEVIEQHLDTILDNLKRHSDIWVKLSLGTEPDYSYDWD